jgi:protein-S-isoprenylcysteine O-methyltransferase Ste14
MKTLFIALRAILYLLGAVALWGWLAFVVRPIDTQIGVLLPAWTEIPGFLLLGVGGLLLLTCVILFILRGRGTLIFWDSPPRFIAVGPYRYVRNTMYVGAFLTLAGFGLYLHSFSVLLLSLVQTLVFHLFVVLFEERGLEQRFGESFIEYKKSVNRWIPKSRTAHTSTASSMSSIKR